MSWNGMRHRSSSLTGRMAIAAIAGALLIAAGLAVRAEFPASARAAGATFTVTSNGDTDDGLCDAHCTLREAIHAANGNTNPSDTDTIAFNIPGAGVHTISPGTGGFGGLPPIMEPVVIDGNTQPGAACQFSNIRIELQGPGISGGGNGLNVVAGHSVIRGLAINQFTVGIFLQTTGFNAIECNHIGTNAVGNATVGQQGTGVLVHSADNRIGGGAIETRNIISGHTVGISVEGLFGADRVRVLDNFIGVDVSGFQSLPNGTGVDLNYGSGHEVRGNVISGNGNGVVASGGVSQAVVADNLIGLDVLGTSALPNGNGVVLANAFNTVVGGTAAADRNFISGNTQHGVQIFLGQNNAVQGNYIGTRWNGTTPLPNGGHGVYIQSSQDNTIGGITAGAGNVISGNGASGIWIEGASATGNQVLGNYIGTNASGTAPIPNNSDGVLVNGAPQNTIGGSAPGASNHISGNGGGGVVLAGQYATGNQVLGNRIGTNAAGTAAIPNAFGVLVNGAPQNTIGGSVPGARNVISGNNYEGVWIGGASSTGNQVLGNHIGTNAAGTAAIPNSYGVSVNGAPQNTIGGSAPGAGNVISGNKYQGVFLWGSASGNQVLGNYIGTNASGTAAIPNVHGVLVHDAPQNTIGGATASARNVISGNSWTGVVLEGQSATGNQVLGNYIGTNAAGTAAIPNPSGVMVSEAPQNTIGGSAPGAGNVISGNATSGVWIGGASATGNQVLGNRIGTNAAGTAAIPNTYGVLVNGAPQNTIGGSAPGAGNVISGNDYQGVWIGGASASGNHVLGNYIGTNPTGTVAIPNNVDGVVVQDAPQNTIGGATASARNVISGNGSGTCVAGAGAGVLITGAGATGNWVQGNYIGTDTLGFATISNHQGVNVYGASSNNIIDNLISGNTGMGVALHYDSANSRNSTDNFIGANKIGTDATGAAGLPNCRGISIEQGTDNRITGNTIAFNNSTPGQGYGVLAYDGAVRNKVWNNSIHSNDGKGILHPALIQPAPSLSLAASNGSWTAVTGTASLLQPNTEYTIDFYSSAVCDPSGFGEGETPLGAGVVNTDGSGNLNITANTSETPVGQFLTATLTNQAGSTSEFSNCIPVTGAPLIPVEAGANGTVWTGDAGTLPGSLLTGRAVRDLPDAVSAVFHWNNEDQRFDFWFRGFPPAFNTLAGLEPGGYYFFQASGSTVINVPGAGAYTVPPPGGQFTTFSGATGWLWSGTNRPLAVLAMLPTGVSAIFHWNNGDQRFDFWFRGFPGPFQTLTGGLQRGGYYFFQSPGGTVVPLD